LLGRALAIQEVGHYPEAQTAIEYVLALRTADGLRADAFEAELHSSLANLHQYQRHPAEALVEFDRALAILRTMATPDREQLAHTLRNLGDIRTSQGDIEGGQKALTESQQLTHQLYGPDHPDSIRLSRMLGRNAQRRGAYDEALAHFQNGWERAQRVFKPPHTVRVLLAHPLALALLHRGDLEAALPIMHQAAAEAAELFPPGHPSRATIAADQSLLLLAAGKLDDARGQATEARDARRALEDTDTSIAQPELILAVLDCLAGPDPAAHAAVAAALERVRGDTQLTPALQEDYAKAAERCP
jgi:serine/threonine-protein kinase